MVGFVEPAGTSVPYSRSCACSSDYRDAFLAINVQIEPHAQTDPVGSAQTQLPYRAAVFSALTLNVACRNAAIRWRSSGQRTFRRHRQTDLIDRERT